MPLGTIVNAGAVVIGSLLGIILKKSISNRLRSILFQALGLFTLVLGGKMAFRVHRFLILVFSMLIGGLIGEALRLEERVGRAADFLKPGPKSDDRRFAEGLVSAFLIFCMGSMTIIGAIDEGIRQDHSLLLTKSVMDGFTSAVLASTYGWGVLFSFIPLFLFQGGITLAASLSEHFFSTVMIDQLTAVGGTMIVGIGINLLEIAKIRVLNFLPALVIVVLLMRFFPAAG